MLKTLRKKGIAKKILIVLAVMVIPAFILWGSSSLIRNRTAAKYAGIIFGRKIGFDEYLASFTACRNQAIMRYGDDFYKLQKFLNLDAESWDRLILMHEAGKRRIKVTDAEVAQKIASYPFFQKNGKFDNNIYQQIVDYVFKTPARDFEEQTRQLLVLEKLFNQITAEINVDENELLQSYTQEKEKIRAEFIQIMPDAFTEQVSVDDKEINDYYQARQQDLKQPPSVNIEYIGIEYPAQAQDTDKTTVMSKAQEVAAKIKKPEDFIKVSETDNMPIKETGFFSEQGPIPDVGWSFPFIQAAFGLKPDQISEPVETQKGVYILKLKEKKDSYIPTIDGAKENIISIIKKEKSKVLAQGKAKEYLQYIIDSYKTNPKNVDFAALAGKWNLKIGESKVISRSDYIESVGRSKDFIDAAFALKDKPEPFDAVTTDTGSFIIHLKEYFPIDKNQFTQDKEEYKKKVLDNKKNIEFNNFFEELRKKARLVNNTSNLAKSYAQ